jgi:hypothetical protein
LLKAEKPPTGGRRRAESSRRERAEMLKAEAKPERADKPAQPAC